MDAGHPLQADRRFVVLIEHVDLGQIPDPEQGAVKMDNIPYPKLPDSLFGKRGLQMISCHGFFLLSPQ
jgi:hypothetical protein